MPPAKRKRRPLQHSLDGVIARQITKVREMREGRISQQQLADMLGVTQAMVTRMESGERSITVAELFQIAAALDCAPIFLLSGAFTGEKVPVTKTVELSPEDARRWLVGDAPLPGGNDALYLDRNIPDDLATRRRESTRQLEDLRAKFGGGLAALIPVSDPRAKDAPIIINLDENS